MGGVEFLAVVGRKGAVVWVVIETAVQSNTRPTLSIRTLLHNTHTHTVPR